MQTVLRCLNEYRHLRGIWISALILTVALPPLALAIPLVERELIDGVILPGRLDLLPQTLLLYSIVWLLSSAITSAGSLCVTYLNERTTNDLRERLFRHCQSLSVAFSNQEHSGRTMSIFSNDIPSFVGGFGSSLIGGIASVITLLLGTWAMFALNWQLAVAVTIIPLLVVGAATVLTRPLRRAARRSQDKTAELTSQLQENLAGLREIVAFGREKPQLLQLSKTLGELLGLRMRVTGMNTIAQTAQGILVLMVTLVLLGYGSFLVIEGQTTLGTLIAMRSMFNMVFLPAGQIFGSLLGIQRALGSADRIYSLFDTPPMVQERSSAKWPYNVTGTVMLDHVSFEYVPGIAVLEDVTFTASPGDVIALVGPSGAGKTTTVSLIARFYDPSSGSVRLDGVDLRDLTLAGLRKQVGFVFQNSFLFAATIRENLAFGQDGATSAEIEAAAKAAHAWEFIERMPGGLDARIGERGVNLSEGQKQRLAIARAMLRNPKILILDEPTSALDARSEHQIQLALDKLMAGRTTFVIAHRLATVRRATQILVLERGRVVQRGSHDELSATPGLYRELANLQFAT